MSNFNVGDEVAIYTASNWGIPHFARTVIEKATKTQYVLANGARYRKEDCREVGVDRYRSSLLIALDDPRIAAATTRGNFMADYTIRTEVTTRIVYTLPSPTYWGEVGKTFAAMRADMEARGIDPSWDDAAKVEAWDDEIRFSFEVKSDD